MIDFQNEPKKKKISDLSLEVCLILPSPFPTLLIASNPSGKVTPLHFPGNYLCRCQLIPNTLRCIKIICRGRLPLTTFTVFSWDRMLLYFVLFFWIKYQNILLVFGYSLQLTEKEGFMVSVIFFPSKSAIL